MPDVTRPNSDVTAALRRAGVSGVDDSPLAQALYATDASLYRVLPRVVVRPHEVSELEGVLAVARASETAITMRGAGTSIAGNAVGPGIVVDTTRLSAVRVDADTRTATVLPGTVHARIQEAAASHGLRFGPDPSTHTRCTVGGMIGNNACGSRALGYGRTSDNLVDLTAMLADGRDVAEVTKQLGDLVDANLGLIRTEFGRFKRQVSGYSMEHLLPERGRSLARFLVGSEGTLAIVTSATVNLVEEPGAKALVVIGYPDMATAADAVPLVLEHGPVACEGLDRRMSDVVAARWPLPELPSGGGWLLVELTGDSAGEAEAKALALGKVVNAPHRVVTDATEQAALWRIREAGAGLAAVSLDKPAHAGWEDAAVPPERLGDYLRDFERLLGDFGLRTVPYGHFGDGCVHARIDFDLSTQGQYRSFVEEAAVLAANYGGSMSGEHGDGRARSELLGRMYSPQAMALMASVKHIFDPDSLLNPGVLVAPAPLDASLRASRVTLPVMADLGTEVHRCTGVGACLAGPGTGVMCPSYSATREEKDSTRGRARVLQEVVTGALPVSSEAVEQALDLCLACKGCARDCPTGVDMAEYKSHVLELKYAGKRRPRSHRILGRLPALVGLAPPAVGNLGLTLGGSILKRVAGIDSRRRLPSMSRRRLSKGGSGDVDVWLWADTFTDHFAADAGRACIEFLGGCGLKVGVIEEPACCAVTWISTGQRERAKEIQRDAMAVFAKYSDKPIIGLEPSCLAALRHDGPRLVGSAPDLLTLSEFLTREQITPPRLDGLTIVAQPHCHHASVLGWDADRALLESAGAKVVMVGGCCGMAGNFGMEEGHYEVSRAVFDHDLAPALAAHPDAVVLADGFSCRTQLHDFAPGRSVMTLAELLAGKGRN